MNGHAKNDVLNIQKVSDIKNRLAARTKVSPEVYTNILEIRKMTHSRTNYKPTQPVTSLKKGTYYLERVDDQSRRFYARAYHTVAGANLSRKVSHLRPVPSSIAAPFVASRVFSTIGAGLCKVFRFRPRF